jgi:hypothetical protein
MDILRAARAKYAVIAGGSESFGVCGGLMGTGLVER